MEQTMRIYRRKIDFISEPEKPLIQIPIKAIQGVSLDVNDKYLNIDANDRKSKDFLKSAFGVRLKKDFSYVYVDNYNQNGLDDDWLSVAK